MNGSQKKKKSWMSVLNRSMFAFLVVISTIGMFIATPIIGSISSASASTADDFFVPFSQSEETQQQQEEDESAQDQGPTTTANLTSPNVTATQMPNITDVTPTPQPTEPAPIQNQAQAVEQNQTQTTGPIEERQAPTPVQTQACADIFLKSGNPDPANPSRDSLNQYRTPAGTGDKAHIIPPYPGWSTIPGTAWISSNNLNTNTWYRVTFTLPSNFVSPSLDIDIHADNWAEIYLNNQGPFGRIGSQTPGPVQSNFRAPPDSIAYTAPPKSIGLFQPGINTLYFRVFDQGTATGLDYNATVTYRCLDLDGTYTYSPKFVCAPEVGPIGDAFFPQDYRTVVNVHNPHSMNVTFVKKAVIALSQNDPLRGNISRLVEETLEPDQALSINCRDILDLFHNRQSPLGDGFVVLNSNHMLDVSAVYTTRESIDVENILPTTINNTGTQTQLPDLTDTITSQG